MLAPVTLTNCKIQNVIIYFYINIYILVSPHKKLILYKHIYYGKFITLFIFLLLIFKRNTILMPFYNFLETSPN